MRHTNRLRLMRQGFTVLDDDHLKEIGPWLRLAPALCALVALAGTALESWLVLWLLAPMGSIAAATAKHPFDLIYDLGIRRWLGREHRLPDYGAPRRFSGGLASAGFYAAGLALLLGSREVGVAIGLFFGGAVLLAATTDICLGCMIFHLLVPRRVDRSPETQAAVAYLLVKRRSITAPRQALRERPQLRRTS